MVLLNCNRGIRWTQAGTLRLRYGPLKSRLTAFVTAFSSEAEGFLKLHKSQLSKCFVNLREDQSLTMTLAMKCTLASGVGQAS